MKFIVHVGMPKCGSTTIQNSLADNASRLADEAGIYFASVDGKFNNHKEMADIVNSASDINFFVNFLKLHIASARRAHCTTILLSTEDLFYFLTNESKINFFYEGFRQVGIKNLDITYVMIYRDLKKFIRSFLHQIISNGHSILNQDLHILCEFYLKLMGRFFSLDGGRISISLENSVNSGGLLPTFYLEALGVNFKLNDRVDNSRGNRGFASEMLSGPLVGLYEANHGLLNNEPISDQFRAQIRNKIDDASKSEPVGLLFAEIDEIFEKQLDLAYSKSIGRIQHSEKFFLNALTVERVVNIPYGLVSNFLCDWKMNLNIDTLVHIKAPPDIHNEILIPTKYGDLCSFENDLISRFLDVYGEWSHFESLFVLENIPNNCRIFDVGGFIGTFSLAMKENRPSFLLSVEPNLSSFAKLKKNLSNYFDSSFHVENCAVGTKEGKVYGNYTEPQNAGSFFISEFAESQEGDQIHLVNIVRLSKLRIKYGDYDFLKLDVEGSEVDVLISDEKWIRENKPIIWAECLEDSRSILLFEKMISMGYDVHFYRYPAYNPKNFKGASEVIFPAAFEAGLFAVKPGVRATCPESAEKYGATCVRLYSVDQFIRALWLTPRWGKIEWESMSRTELLATCSRLALTQDLTTFFSATNLSEKRLSEGHSMSGKSVDESVGNCVFFRTRELTESSLEYWMVSNITNFTNEQCIQGLLHLSGIANNSLIDGTEEFAISIFQRAIGILHEWRNRTESFPEWVKNLYEKMLLESGITCSKIAFRVLNENRPKAAKYFTIGASMLSELLIAFPTQQSWVTERHERLLLESGVIFGDLAIELKKSGNDLLALANWRKAIADLQSLLDVYPNQADWVTKNFDHQLLECGILLSKLSARFINVDDAQAAEYSEQSAKFLAQLCERNPTQPVWVFSYHESQLREAGFAFSRVASKYENKDDNFAVENLGCAIRHLDQLKKCYPNQPDWVYTEHKTQLQKCAFLYEKMAQALNKIDDIKAAANWRFSSFFLGRLIDEYRDQISWKARHAKQLLEGAMAFNRAATRAERDLQSSLECSNQSAELLKELLAKYPDQPSWVFEYFKNQREAIICANMKAVPVTLGAVKIHVDFVNMKAELFGLVKLAINISAPMHEGRSFSVTLCSDGNDNAIKFLKGFNPSNSTISFGIHTQLLENGNRYLDLSLISDDGNKIYDERIEFTVHNTGDLSYKVRDSLRKNGVPLFLVGSCDASLYDYSDSSLTPWFDRPDAAQVLNRWFENGEISQREFYAMENFVNEGFIVLEDLIDQELIAGINQEIDEIIDSGYQGFVAGSSQRLTLLHKIKPSIRTLLFDRRYLDVIDKLFQVPAQPCQSLLYVNGSQQAAHQDTIHLTPFPAGYMCGVWIALEDINADSGELEIFPRSHRLPRAYMHRFECEKVTNNWSEFENKIVANWQSLLQSNGLQKKIYRPKAGTVLIWHENLMHGGRIRKNLNLTRRSIVFHCFAQGAVNFYDSTGDIGMIESTEPMK